MRKLKCIGGPKSGTYLEIDNSYQEHDVVRLPSTVEFSIPDFEEDLRAFRENRIPDYIAPPYHMYKIAVIRFSKTDRVEFLIPINGTFEEAVRQALT